MAREFIGVFDSGVGGLSVLAELQARLPHEHFLYFADSANVPYGPRGEDEIASLTHAAATLLHERGCKALVVACNTASAYSLTPLRAHFGDWPIIGLEPAVKPAALASTSGVVGVMATAATLRGAPLQRLMRHWEAETGAKMLPVTHPDLVPLVEAGRQNSTEMRALLRDLLGPLAEAGADQLVLGCTHYPFLKESIAAEFGDQFNTMDSGRAVAEQTARRVGGAPNGQTGHTAALCSRDAAALGRAFAELLSQDVTPELVSTKG